MCAQQRLRSTYAYAQVAQSHRYPTEDALGTCLPTECPAQSLIRLRGCAGWSEPSLGAHAVLLEMLCPGPVNDKRGRHLLILAENFKLTFLSHVNNISFFSSWRVSCYGKWTLRGIFPINKRRKIGAIDCLYIYFTVQNCALYTTHKKT